MVPENPMQKQRYFIKAEAILKFLLETDEAIDTLITCQGSRNNIITSDLDLYQALGSVKDYDNVNLHRLVKFFEVVDIISYKNHYHKEKPLLKEEKVEELRKSALKSQPLKSNQLDQGKQKNNHREYQGDDKENNQQTDQQNVNEQTDQQNVNDNENNEKQKQNNENPNNNNGGIEND